MESKGLGAPKEDVKGKIFYFIFIIGVIAFLAWSAIGIGVENPTKLRMLNYYLWLALISLAFILFDNATLKRFRYIDTVTIEKTPFKLKYLLIIGLFFAVILGWRIFTTQTAWVNYPQFQVFDGKIPNAFLSGICGVVENWFFFATLLPTIFAVLNMKVFNNKIMSSIVSILMISSIFMIFHFFVYGASEMALMSTFLFALVNSIFVVGLKSVVVADYIHFTNNFIADMINAGVALVF